MAASQKTYIVPDFLKLAISHESHLIAIRKMQIEGYAQRIELMKAGIDYETAQKKVPPVKCAVGFDSIRYSKLKKEYIQKQLESRIAHPCFAQKQ